MKTSEIRLIVARTDKRGGIQIFRSSVEGNDLDFVFIVGRKMKNDHTESEWDISTGEAISGPLKGESLIAVPGTVSIQKAWTGFYPDEPLVE